MDATNSLLLVLFAPPTAACFIAFFCRQRPLGRHRCPFGPGVIFVASLMATLQFTRLGDLSASMGGYVWVILSSTWTVYQYCSHHVDDGEFCGLIDSCL